MPKHEKKSSTALADGTKMVGVVKWFDDTKGFGFIEAQDGTEVFVHHSEIMMNGRRKLDEGQDVSFSTKNTPKGLAAVEVTVIS